LAVTNWQTITNVVTQRSPLEIIDPQVSASTQRFYQAVQVP
jgi:hypothetical protein